MKKSLTGMMVKTVKKKNLLNEEVVKFGSRIYSKIE